MFYERTVKCKGKGVFISNHFRRLHCHVWTNLPRPCQYSSPSETALPSPFRTLNPQLRNRSPHNGFPAKRLGRNYVGADLFGERLLRPKNFLGLLALSSVSDRPSIFQPDCCFRTHSPPIKDQAKWHLRPLPEPVAPLNFLLS